MQVDPVLHNKINYFSIENILRNSTFPNRKSFFFLYIVYILKRNAEDCILDTRSRTGIIVFQTSTIYFLMYLSLGFSIHLFFVSSVVCTLQLDYVDDPNAPGKGQNGSSECDGPECGEGYLRLHQIFVAPVVVNYFFPPCGSEDCDDNATTTTPVKPGVVAGPRTKKFTVEFDLTKKPRAGLDLYWLMDGTTSFSSTRNNWKNQADEFIDAVKGLKSVGEDYRIGYGTFTDKTGTPRKRRSADRADELGRAANVYWTPNHGLYNTLRLTKVDTKTLKDTITKTIKTIQSSRSEDILTGLHQVATCSEIGWRENARKVILLTTDQTYYAAGIKKFVGDPKGGQKDTTELVTPYDGKCHLNKEGYFRDGYNKFDYPSVEQVLRPLHDKGIIIIFGIGQTSVGDWDLGTTALDIFDEYKKKYAPALNTKPLVYPIHPDSPHIMLEITSIIERAFDIVRQNEILEVTVTPESMRNVTSVKSKCITKIGEENDICKVNEKDEKVAYEVEITLNCPGTYTDLNVAVNLKGSALPPLKPIDLRSFCG